MSTQTGEVEPSVSRPLPEQGAPRNSQLVIESRRLRDQLLRMPSHASADLIKALRPFDRDDPITDETMQELSRVFESAYDSAAKTLDEYTLANVLAGRSPHQANDGPWSAISLVLIGFFLVFAAFHYTYWANRTTSLLAQSDKFIEFQHLERVMAAAEKLAFASVGTTPTEQDDGSIQPTPTTAVETEKAVLDAALMQELEILRYQYQMERTLPGNLDEHSDNFNPVLRFVRTAQNATCSNLDGLARLDPSDLRVSEKLLCGTAIRNYQKVLGAQEQNGVVTRANNASFQQLGPINPPDPAPRNPVMTLGNKAIDDVQFEADRSAKNNYTQSIFRVEIMQSELKQKLNVVHFWALPIIYGTLGALTYCLWRTLTPRVSNLGFWHPVMRMIFAGLAALTISMLFIPANVITIDQNAQKPLIYLMSFIFGYSIEGFIRLLNKMNEAIENSTSQRPRAT